MSGIKIAKNFAKYKITDMSVGVSTHVHVSPIITIIITIITYNNYYEQLIWTTIVKIIVIISLSLLLLLLFLFTKIIAGLQNQK